MTLLFSFMIPWASICPCNKETVDTNWDSSLRDACDHFVSFHFNIEPSCRDKFWPHGITQGEQLKHLDSHLLNQLAEAK